MPVLDCHCFHLHPRLTRWIEEGIEELTRPMKAVDMIGLSDSVEHQFASHCKGSNRDGLACESGKYSDSNLELEITNQILSEIRFMNLVRVHSFQMRLILLTAWNINLHKNKQ